MQVYPAANLVLCCSEKTKKWIIDPKAEEISNPSGFTRISEKAGDGVSAVIKEIITSLS